MSTVKPLDKKAIVAAAKKMAADKDVLVKYSKGEISKEEYCAQNIKVSILAFG